MQSLLVQIATTFFRRCGRAGERIWPDRYSHCDGSRRAHRQRLRRRRHPARTGCARRRARAAQARLARACREGAPKPHRSRRRHGMFGCLRCARRTDVRRGNPMQIGKKAITMSRSSALADAAPRRRVSLSYILSGTTPVGAAAAGQSLSERYSRNPIIPNLSSDTAGCETGCCGPEHQEPTMIKELMSTRRFAPLFWAQFFCGPQRQRPQECAGHHPALWRRDLAWRRAGDGRGRGVHLSLLHPLRPRRRARRQICEGRRGAAAEIRRDLCRGLRRASASSCIRCRCCSSRSACSASSRRCSVR